ncbi:glutaredoxin family protein [Ectobacillus sp. JY-23]|uniref:glutaredoxin family protein n=1 Tax=Ectobacillus sp. JY-23 TaxID=2933872 RepID=UPI001FF6B39E|nr:glutaredoxin family protein [Ectobacillus sp. JY-23]UOY92376.1 glutaredoxin family protein [Ectobacillus sp. JY-23]
MSETKTIVVWSRTGCHHCDEIKAYLQANKYAYELVDIEGRDYLRDILELKYGVRYVPVVEIGANGRFEAVLEKDYKRIEELVERNA